MEIKSLLFKWLPVFFWGGVIFYLSAMPAAQASENKLLDHLLHDLAHIIEYGILFFLLARALDEGLMTFPRLTFSLLLIYSILDELHQYFVPTRQAKVEDILFDLLGGWLVWKFLQRIQLPKLKI